MALAYFCLFFNLYMWRNSQLYLVIYFGMRYNFIDARVQFLFTSSEFSTSFRFVV